MSNEIVDTAELAETEWDGKSEPSDVAADMVAARSWPTDDAIKLIQDTFTGRVEPEAFVVADLPRCPRCDGVCGRIQCSEGMKTPGARRAA